MKQLNLRINKKHFQEILKGDIKEEVRFLTPDNNDRYVTETENPDGTINIDPIPYDVIRFSNGPRNNPSRMLVEVKKATFFIVTDEDGNDLTYEESGETYVVCHVTYELGKVLETENIGE